MRASTMMLSRTGRDRGPPLGRGKTAEGRRAPWGCAAGAPYRGTASPPPPPPSCMPLWQIMQPHVWQSMQLHVCTCGR